MSAVELWADFRGQPPGADALRHAGITGVIRYIGLGSAAKRITAAEYAGYVRGHIRVALVAELGTADAWQAADDRGYGVEVARDAVADARRKNIPDTVPIACAADAHATAGQVRDAVRYAQGFASVIGHARAGGYGFREVITALHDANAVGWLWLCGSRPPAAWRSWLTFWQRNTGTVHIGGTDCDINERYAPLPTEADMPLTPAEKSEIARLCALEVWGYLNKVAGDKVDMRQALVSTRDLAGRFAAQGNNITADQLAAALAPKLTAGLLPQLQAAIERVAVQGDAKATAVAVVAELAQELAAASGQEATA